MSISIKSQNEASYSSHDDMLPVDNWANGTKLDYIVKDKVVALNLHFDIVIDFPIQDRDKLADSVKSSFANALEKTEAGIDTWLAKNDNARRGIAD